MRTRATERTASEIQTLINALEEKYIRALNDGELFAVLKQIKAEIRALKSELASLANPSGEHLQ